MIFVNDLDFRILEANYYALSVSIVGPNDFFLYTFIYLVFINTKKKFIWKQIQTCSKWGYNQSRGIFNTLEII